MSEKNTIGIYRINTDHQELEGVATMDLKIDHIVHLHEQKKRQSISDFVYTPMILNSTAEIPEGYRIKAFRYKRSNQNSWQSFLTSNFDGIPQLINMNHDFLIFVFRDEAAFCFTGGSANYAIADFIDIAFPLDVMKRIVDPEKIKEAKSRSMTGELYAREHLYRGYSTISAAESFGQVWSDLSASVKESIWEDPDMSVMLGPKKRISVEVKNFFKLKKSVDFPTILRLISRLNELTEEPINREVEEAFSFLESVRLIKEHTLKEALKNEVMTALYAYVTEGGELDYDYCNVNYDDYLDASEYGFAYRNLLLPSFETNPTAEEVIDRAKEFLETEHFEALESLEKFCEHISHFRMETSQDEPLHQTSGTIFQHLHGEVNYGGKNYFLVDKEWYEIRDNFIESIANDFTKYASDDSFITRNSISLNSWTTGREGVYNDSYFTNSNFIVGDRITINGIEVFDLLYHGDPNNLYVIHVKKGLGGKTRESCSQIRNSAKLIQTSINSGNKKLKELYRKLKASPTDTGADRAHGLTEAAFLALFKRNITYVLASSGVANPTAVRRSRSNIAKFEILTTRDVLKTYDIAGSLKISLLN